MAVDGTKVAQTSDFSGFLSPEMSAPIFDQVNKTSIVQQLARQIPMGANGVDIPFWDGSVSASWVGESEMKPITKGKLDKQTLKPSKIATIFVESAEVVRANPGNYLNIMRGKVAEAIALAFDAAALAGTSTPFDSYVGQTTKSVSLVDANLTDTTATDTNTYLQLNAALSALVNDGYKMTGTLFDDVAEPVLNGAVDGNGRPLFIDSPIVDTAAAFRGGRVLGRPAFLSDHVKDGTTIGYTGDWSQLVWGQVGGLSYDVSDQATLNLGTEASPNMVSLWQYNLVAVRVEAEYAILCNQPEAFVKLTNETDAA